MKKMICILLACVIMISSASLTVFAAEDSVLVDIVNQAVTEQQQYEFTWSVTSAGVLKVVASGNPAYRYTIVYPDGSATLPQKINKEWELTEPGSYTIYVGAYDNTNYSYTNGSVNLKLSFISSEGSSEAPPVMKDYQISNQKLMLGSNTVDLLEIAVTTIFEFKPSVIGVYTFTAPVGAIVGYWGAGSWFLNNPGSTSNTCEWTCTSVGQSAYIGISGDQSQVDLDVSKTGDYKVTVYEEVPYQNKAEVSPFTLPEDVVLGDYVNVQEVHDAVLGSDGYYHLDSVNGPVLLVDMNYQDIILTAVLSSDRPVMFVYTDELTANGNYVKYSISAAVQEYEAAADANGYYPLTEDLMMFYRDYAISQGIYSFYVSEEYNDDTVWMYCMRTVLKQEESCPHTTCTYVNNNDGTHDRVCSVCGDVEIDNEKHIIKETAAANDSDTCVCGHEAFGFAGMSLELQSSLLAKFVIATKSVSGTDNYAIIEKEVYNKKTGEITIEELRIDQADWGYYDTAKKMYQIEYAGVAAMQMTDKFVVKIFNAAGEQISVNYSRTIKHYLMKTLETPKTPEMGVLCVDFLNYGAAAQSLFKYRTTELANADLTAEQQAKATTDAEIADLLKDSRVKGAMLNGTTVQAEYEIIPTFVYVKNKMTGIDHVKISYTNFKGVEITKTVKVSELPDYDANNYKVEVKGMQVPDGLCLITVELCDAAGNVKDTTVDNVTSYAYRSYTTHPAYGALIKVIYSADQAFG